MDGGSSMTDKYTADMAVQEARRNIDRILQELDEVLKGERDVLGR